MRGAGLEGTGSVMEWCETQDGRSPQRCSAMVPVRRAARIAQKEKGLPVRLSAGTIPYVAHRLDAMCAAYKKCGGKPGGALQKARPTPLGPPSTEPLPPFSSCSVAA